MKLLTYVLIRYIPNENIGRVRWIRDKSGGGKLPPPRGLPGKAADGSYLRSRVRDDTSFVFIPKRLIVTAQITKRMVVSANTSSPSNPFCVGRSSTYAPGSMNKEPSTRKRSGKRILRTGAHTTPRKPAKRICSSICCSIYAAA